MASSWNDPASLGVNQKKLRPAFLKILCQATSHFAVAGVINFDAGTPLRKP
jgi:hypothetical protein